MKDSKKTQSKLNNSALTPTEGDVLHTHSNGSLMTNTFKSKFFIENSNSNASLSSSNKKQVFFKSKIFN